MTVIGITGPTGAGKTTVLKEIEALGGAVIDCDAVYHEMLESDRSLQDGGLPRPGRAGDADDSHGDPSHFKCGHASRSCSSSSRGLHSCFRTLANLRPSRSRITTQLRFLV